MALTWGILEFEVALPGTYAWKFIYLLGISYRLAYYISTYPPTCRLLLFHTQNMTT